MSLFDEAQGKDLFDNLLENPDLPMSVNETIQTFLEKLQQSQLLKCAVCFRSLADKVFICTHGKMYCVACFADISTDSESYLIINLGKRIFRHSRWTVHEELEVLQLMQNYGVDNYQEIARNMPTKKSSEHIQKYQSKVFDFLPASEAEATVKPSAEPWRKLSNRFKDCLEEYSVLDYMIGHLHEQSDPEMSAFVLEQKRQEDLQMQRVIRSIEVIAKNYPRGGAVFGRQQEQERKDAKVFQQKMKEAEEFSKATEELLKECDEIIQQRWLYDHKRGRKRRQTQPTIQPTKIKRLRKARQKPKPTTSKS